MRLLGHLDREDHARRLGDHLLTLDMPSHVDAAADGRWELWIEHDDDLEKGRAEFAAFAADPTNARFNGKSDAAAQIRRRKQEKAERLRRNFTDVRTSWAGFPKYASTLVIGLIVACLLVAMLTHLGERRGPVMQALLFRPALLPDLEALLAGGPDADTAIEQALQGESGMFSAVADGQAWRLVTPILLHFGALHLVFNLYWLWHLGSMVEGRRGSLFFAAFVLVAAAFSNSAEALFADAAPGHQRAVFLGFGGMSGVNYALFGFAWMRGRLAPHERIGVEPYTVGIMLAWLVLCFVGFVGNVANWAHLAGLATGVAWARLPSRRA